MGVHLYMVILINILYFRRRIIYQRKGIHFYMFCSYDGIQEMATKKTSLCIRTYFVIHIFIQLIAIGINVVKLHVEHNYVWFPEYSMPHIFTTMNYIPLEIKVHL